MITCQSYPFFFQKMFQFGGNSERMSFSSSSSINPNEQLQMQMRMQMQKQMSSINLGKISFGSSSGSSSSSSSSSSGGGEWSNKLSWYPNAQFRCDGTKNTQCRHDVKTPMPNSGRALMLIASQKMKRTCSFRSAPTTYRRYSSDFFQSPQRISQKKPVCRNLLRGSISSRLL